MISFVWSLDIPVYSGRGGTESYTIGQIRELNSRGIPARLITIGLGKADGRQFFPDVDFFDLETPEQLADLDDTIVYVTIPHAVKTKRPSFTIIHCPPDTLHIPFADFCRGAQYSTLIANSRFMRNLCSEQLEIPLNKIHVVYPFADSHFASVKRVKMKTNKTRVLYAGRLIHEKGVYTLLEALHHDILMHGDYSFAVTNAGNQTIHGMIIEHILRRHPWVRVLSARHTPADMARLFARYDIVVMPSNHQFWHEAFGMVSVEAQHAGCRVVASGADGLLETNCGELILFEPGNSYSLAQAIERARKAGPLAKAQRREAVKHFTRAESVDALLAIIDSVPAAISPTTRLKTATLKV
ncbi:MAG TPA: glycosyltransferase family 4 protein [Candidatus Saccharimonadales bacterium]|nr:glycosyltransferase family 4 protein [Candidatus Saccharimonadales bacterium]